MNIEAIKLRKLQLSDIKSAMGLVLAEGWNQTKNDWELLIENQQNICLAAEVEGEFAATATAINYSNKVAWIGMVLVDKKYRGRGISKILLNSLFENLKTCNSIKLDATPAGQPVYKKVRFTSEYLINRMVNMSVKKLPVKNILTTPQKIQEKDIPEIIKFDKTIFGTNRAQLIKSLINDYPDKSWVLKQNNKITGFSLGREGNKFHQIGPISALSSENAKILINQALDNLLGQSVVLDILNDKQELETYLNSVGFIKQRSFMRMFQEHNPFPGEVSSQYLISGPEFG